MRETRRGRERPVLSFVGWREWPDPRQPWEVRRAWAFILGVGVRRCLAMQRGFHFLIAEIEKSWRTILAWLASTLGISHPYLLFGLHLVSPSFYKPFSSYTTY